MARPLKVLLALCFAASVSLPVLPGAAFAEEDGSGGTATATVVDGATTAAAADEDSGVPQADPVALAIAQVVDGLLANFEVENVRQLYKSDAFPADDGTAQFLAFDLVRLGLTDGADTYLKRVTSYITDAYASEQAGLSEFEPTVWGRTAMVVNALGGDPTAIGKDASGNPANLLSDGIYNWSYTDNISDQGSNALIYGLQALDACGVQVPPDAKYTQQDLVAQLLACQAKDGSFGLSLGNATGSVDLTGMALSALAPYAGNKEVDAAIQAGVKYLSAQQTADGRFTTEEGTTSESISMAIIGLAACGIDPSTDERFVKNGISLVDALIGFQREDGMIRHTFEDNPNFAPYLATEQALRALIAVEELHAGGDGNVYTLDMQVDVPLTQNTSSGTGIAGLGSYLAEKLPSLALGVGIGLIIVLLFWGIRKARRVQRLRKG